MQGGCAGRRVRDTRYLLIVCVLGGLCCKIPYVFGEQVEDVKGTWTT